MRGLSYAAAYLEFSSLKGSLPSQSSTLDVANFCALICTLVDQDDPGLVREDAEYRRKS